MKPRIFYKAGYKYQLYETYKVQTPITGYMVSDRYFAMDIDGLLTIREGYAWDGPSGPTIDTLDFMRGSLVHDALYQMMGAGMIDLSHRKAADQLLRAICREDGMSAIRAWWVYRAVRWAGGEAAREGDTILTAP